MWHHQNTPPPGYRHQNTPPPDSVTKIPPRISSPKYPPPDSVTKIPPNIYIYIYNYFICFLNIYIWIKCYNSILFALIYKFPIQSQLCI